MRKSLSIFFAFIGMAFSAYANPIVFFTKDANFSLTYSQNVLFYSNSPNVSLNEKIVFEVDMKELQLDLKTCVNNSNFDISFNSVYAPTIYDTFNLGLKSLFHYENSFNTYNTFDFLFGPIFYFPLSKRFSIETTWMYFASKSQIFTIKEECPWINTSSIAFYILWRFNPTGKLHFGLKISSYNDFKYNLFFAPFYSLYAKIYLNNAFSIGFDTEVSYIDMFTLSANLRYFYTAVNLSWNF